MSIEETFQAGIAAAKSGDLARAAILFGQVVQADPHSEQGWLWLGLCCSPPDRREYCFRRVLALNPNNAEARSQLERMAGPAPVTPAWALPPQTDIPKKQNEQPAIKPSVQRSDERTVPPFLPGAPSPQKPLAPISPAVPASEDLSNALIAPEEKPALPIVKAAGKIERPRTFEPKKKKPNNVLVVLLGFIVTLIVGGIAVLFFMLSGGLNNLLPGYFVPIPTSIPLAALLTPKFPLPQVFPPARRWVPQPRYRLQNRQ